MSARKGSKNSPDKASEEEDNLAELDEIAKKAFVKYGEETCPVCHSRFDEYGYCACGAGGN